MASALNRYDIERVLLDTLRAAADEPGAALAADFRLGTGAVCADLAVLAGEWIGFAIRAADEPVSDVPHALRAYARFFDRVALVVDARHLPALRPVDLGGAALWSVTDDGKLVEHAAGAANVVGMSALLDLLSVDERRGLLRPLISKGPVYDRSAPPITAAEVRRYVEATLAAEHGATAALLRAA
jgi:hypothetical protein